MQNLNNLWFQKWHEVLVELLGELRVMTLKGDPKFKRKLTCGLKNDLRNSVNFHSSSRKSENLHFDGLFLSKAYENLDGKVKNIFAS